MREIKCKVWDKRDKIFLQYTVGMLNTLTNCFSDGRLEFLEYIGFKDKNGKEIYKGDIIRAKDDVYTDGEDTFIREVKYKNGMFCLDDNSYAEEFRALYWYDDIEIIGNIYENPELLKESE